MIVIEFPTVEFANALGTSLNNGDRFEIDIEKVRSTQTSIKGFL